MKKINWKLSPLMTACWPLALAAGLGFLSGCNAAQKHPAGVLPVSVSETGAISVDGKRVELDKLGAKAKSMGATAGTVIRISIPKDFSNTARAEIGRSLASAGFRRFIFIEPRQAEAVVHDKTPETRR